MNGKREYVKLKAGDSVTLTISKIAKQDIVNLESENKVVTLFSEQAKEQLRTLWAADRANPQGPLVGKAVKVSRLEKGYRIEVVGHVAEPEGGEEAPF